MSKQTIYNVGIYVRLSQEDMRAGESLSIENQKLILTKYVTEQGWNTYDIYVDDGFSGTDFNRPGVTRLLEDAKTGKINLIIVKDLSRFGRNYIQVGQYIDYIFPTYNIRFIALSDNVDTANKDTTAMDMMPIVNLFNEWHAASTSKKIRAVVEANAKAGKYRTTFAPYGYVKGDDENRLPVVDEPAASVVRRIFEMRSQGISPYHIAEKLNDEKIPIPSDYLYAKLGKPNPRRTIHLWSAGVIRQIVRNPTYLGHLVQMKTTTVSYKNHKSVKKDPSEWIIVYNTHEPLVSQEIWDKCREVEESVSQGKKTKTGFVAPLSGLMFCADCGEKMRLGWNNTTNGSKKKPRKYVRHNFNCGRYNRQGKQGCPSHYIKMNDINALILADIRSMAALVWENEGIARKQFLSKKEQINSRQTAEEQKRLHDGQYRLSELEKLIPSIYEDKVLGKIPENVCINLLEKYQAEQKSLSEEVEQLEAKLNAVKQDENDVDEFIKRLKKYTDVQELTREMCLELIEYITIDEYSADRPRDIHIYYKLLEKPLPHKKFLEVGKGNEGKETA
ncbi:MAG: recombinase family protein [Oscillospiraceae bacterium]|nr:recombinase family protein [Oscillospiraceae bacterium]